MHAHASAITISASRWLQGLLMAMSLAMVAAEPFPKGQVLPKVTCLEAPTYSYALYLPKTYREDQPAPVLFGFSPGGMGREPVDLFMDAADRFGFILVGSNDVRNGELRPMLKAQAALWKDVHSRFKVDPKRSYSVGFSGGARMAMHLAEDHVSAFAGVISFGAFGTGRTSPGMNDIGFVLACGEEDFNHWELVHGARSLRSQAKTVWEDRYPNGHNWPPEAFGMEALTFLQIHAIKRGLVPDDPELRAGFLARRRGAAEAAEGRGELLLARRRWEGLATGFPSTAEGLEAKQRIPLLSNRPQLKVEVDLETAYEKRPQELQRLQGTTHYAKALARMQDQLPQATPAEACNIRRVLNGEGTKFHELAVEAMKAGDWDRAVRYLSVQGTLQTKEPWPSLYLAAVLCQMGKPEEAVKQVQEACRRGFRQVHTLRDSNMLKGLQGRPDFERLLEQLSSQAGTRSPEGP